MMEDRYLFRGKCADNGNWVCGNFCIDGVGDTRIEVINDLELWEASYIVDPSTIGQCTGLRDKNGTLIFGGDIVGCLPYKKMIRGVVMWDASTSNGMGGWNAFCPMGKFEVLGNTHDTPEPLKEVEDA